MAGGSPDSGPVIAGVGRAVGAAGAGAAAAAGADPWDDGAMAGATVGVCELADKESIRTRVPAIMTHFGLCM